MHENCNEIKVLFSAKLYMLRYLIQQQQPFECAMLLLSFFPSAQSAYPIHDYVDRPWSSNYQLIESYLRVLVFEEIITGAQLLSDSENDSALKLTLTRPAAPR